MAQVTLPRGSLTAETHASSRVAPSSATSVFFPFHLPNTMDLGMEEYDLVGAAAIDDETAVIVSETDAAEAHSHSSSSSDEADFGEEEYSERYSERSSSWLSSSATQQHRQHPHDDDSSDDSSDDNANDKNLMKDESAAVGSYQDDLYCENMDDEDEAWVYQHMRGGGGREELMNAQHMQRHSQRQSHFETCTAKKNEHHRRVKKLRRHEDESSTRRDTDGDGEAAFESESNENDQLQQQQHHDHQHHQQKEASKSNQSKQQQQQRQQPASTSSTMSLVKPRSSDAILSCPSCFNIVCMDCQQHEKYANQYRAMFVMNIGVDWSRKMIYDDAMGCLKLLNGSSDGTNGSSTAAGGALSEDRQMGEENMDEDNDDDINMQLRDAVNLGEGGGVNSRHPDKIPEEHHEASSIYKVTQEERSEEYDSFYSVHCSYCRHEVAALDMNDEIYYFFGCIASA